jgi:nucleoside 2-deoxyribosyltransferase
VYKIYFAGDLFDQKHITGNLLLAKQIEKESNNMYKCMLPQDWEGSPRNTAIDNRNKDITSIIQADAVLFNFDGVDLDSGTMVEFMVAKMLDIPAVLLRTDVRNGGYMFGDDWNLMALGYPRCITVKHLALMMYNEIGLEAMHRTMAQSIISAFEVVTQEPSLLTSYAEIVAAYQHVIKMCGGQLEHVISPEALHAAIAAKIEKNIYAVADAMGTGPKKSSQTHVN